MSRKFQVLGIDIGGTKIAACVADADGNVLGSTRLQATDDYPDTMARTAAAVQAMLAEMRLPMAEIDAIGICAPGPLDLANGVMIRTPNRNWHDAPVRDDLSRLLGRPAAMDNDANAGGLAEWFFGAGKGKRDLIYLTMSTGVGGGIICNGKLLTGASGNAGEVGHIVLDLNGPMCGCGQRGCLEAYCGGRAVQLRLQEMLRDRPGHAMYQLPCVAGKFENLNFQAVREGAKAHIPLAMEMWDEICLRLAQGIGICMAAFNPELIVLGTSAYYAGDFLLDPVKRYLPRFAWREFTDYCTIRTSALGLKVGELAGVSVAFHSLYERGEWRPE
jgi:glucokinase